MKSLKGPFYPIIYVRGYAGTEVEETVATPYMGFNLGATKVRQRWDGKVMRQVFESPLVRLMKDFDYRDIYSDGDTINQESPVQPRSVIIYRYYDQVSNDLGIGERPEIEVFTEGLSRLILDLKRQVCDVDNYDPTTFKVNLVEEESAIYRTYKELFEDERIRNPHLFSVYLSKASRTGGRNRGRSPLVFAVDLRVRVPDYEISGFLFFDDHIEGAMLFNETIIIAAVPPADDDGAWEVRYGLNPGAINPTPRKAVPIPAQNGLVFEIPLKTPGGRRPGINSVLELSAQPWN